MPTTLDAIVIVIFFIAPGFFSAQLLQKKMPGPLASDGRLDSAAVGPDGVRADGPRGSRESAAAGPGGR